MPRHRKNSEWQRRTSELRTDRGLVDKGVENEDALARLMAKYRDAVSNYLEYVLRRDKVPPDEVSAAITPVWLDTRRAMSSKLAAEWVTGRYSFRDLLVASAHEAVLGWYKPEIRRLMAFELDRKKREAWARRMRAVILATAWDRLEAYQRENRNQYHAILRLREDNSAESVDALNAKLPPRPGGRRQDPVGFRKALERARDLFGRYLCDEVEAGYPKGVVLGVEDRRRDFIEMNLLEYAEASRFCRWRMKLGAEVTV